MLIERIDRLDRFLPSIPGLDVALQFLRDPASRSLPDGRYPLAEDRVIAIIEHYTPKPLEHAVWESHRKYTDVQCVLSGVEQFGYVDRADAPPLLAEYNLARDVMFYDATNPQPSPGASPAPLQWLTLKPGQVALFFPDDVHAPGVAVVGPPSAEANGDPASTVHTPATSNSIVHKVVIKLLNPSESE